MRNHWTTASMVATLLLGAAPAQAGITLVAAENFYADIAEQIAGPDTPVRAILSNPDQDPHLFEASPSVARALADATIVVANGAFYDPWITKLLAGADRPGRTVIIAANLAQWKQGGNPHLWYDLRVIGAVATAIAGSLDTVDPARKMADQQRLERFLASLQPIAASVARIKQRFAGAQVAATEPVFGLMQSALGLRPRDERFGLAVMNNTEPPVSDVAAFEDDLRQRRIRVLIYNRQTTDPASRRLRDIATGAGIPVVAVTETMPPGMHLQDWLQSELAALAAALEASA